jgi:hypothetical protein
MIVGRSICIGMGLAALVGAAPLAANGLPRLTREQLLERADLVVIARPMECPVLPARGAPCPDSMQVVVTVKGNPAIVAFAFSQSPMMEARVDCCRPGRLYLMYLRERGPGYGSVNGASGVIDLSENPGRIGG